MCLERHCATEHGIEKDSQGPNIHKESFVSFVYDDFWCKVSWSTTLFLNYLPFLNNLGNTKIADLDALLAVEEDVIKLDISMNDRSAVNMCQGVCYLFENEFCIGFLKSALAFYQSEEVTPSSILHDHKQMFA